MTKRKTKNNNKTSRKDEGSISSEIIAGLFATFIGIALAAAVAFNLYVASLPPIKNLDKFKPNIVTKFYSDDGEIIKTFTAFTFEKVTIDEIPIDIQNAIVATEDKSFFTHKGYDMYGLARSTIANILAGRVVQGASTLTQQLARVLFLSNEKTFTRKIKELVIAARIEKSISKDKILEMYLNNVYLGSGAYGVAGAAQIYFDKKLDELTTAECALLAGLPQAPSVYSPFNNKDLAIQRRNQVLKRMYKMKFLTKRQYEDAKKEDVKLNPDAQIYVRNKAPYFCDLVMKELEGLGFDEKEISQGGYKVITTLDSKAQDAANEAIKKNMKAWGLTKNNQQAAIFSFSPQTGKILAYAGGKRYSQSQYDRVVQAIRPPGSAFKPFVYAAAVEKGLEPNDMIEDLPFEIGDWAPKNYGYKYRGAIPAYSALMISSNVCAARLIEFTGIKPVIQMVRMLGLTTPIEYDYTIALGSNGVKLYEITRAYGAFANRGYKVEPYAVERVETSKGKVVYEAPETKSRKVMDENTAAIITAMLKTVPIGGTGRASYIGKPMAGKTGTTDDYKDAWFMGYTPNIVTGVWVGSDDNVRTRSVTGGTVPALIWRDTMKVATEPYGNVDFDYPKVSLMPFSLKDKGVIIKPDDIFIDEDGNFLDTDGNVLFFNDEESAKEEEKGFFFNKSNFIKNDYDSGLIRPFRKKPKLNLAPIPMARPIDLQSH